MKRYYNADNSRHSDTDRHNQQGSDHSTELMAWARSGLGSRALWWYLDIPLSKGTNDKLSLVKQAAKIRTKIDRELDNRKGLEGCTSLQFSHLPVRQKIHLEIGGMEKRGLGGSSRINRINLH